MSSTAEVPRMDAKRSGSPAPIIIDLGKRRKKDVNRLREGSGKLVDEVSGCIEELVASGACAADAQPIILIVREKRKAGSFLLPRY